MALFAHINLCRYHCVWIYRLNRSRAFSNIFTDKVSMLSNIVSYYCLHLLDINKETYCVF